MYPGCDILQGFRMCFAGTLVVTGCQHVVHRMVTCPGPDGIKGNHTGGWLLEMPIKCRVRFMVIGVTWREEC